MLSGCRKSAVLRLPAVSFAHRRSSLASAFRAAFGAVALLVAAAPLFGQATAGKIQGRVTDASTGQPIEGAQLSVDGTTLGNITNDEGFYFINEVT